MPQLRHRRARPSPNHAADVPRRRVVAEIIGRFGVPPGELAKYLGTSLVSVVRWERGDIEPGPRMWAKLADVLQRLERGEALDIERAVTTHVFASRGARRASDGLPLFHETDQVRCAPQPKAAILSRLRDGDFWGDGAETLGAILTDRGDTAPTIAGPAAEGVSAGKNTYTYDAHTYHKRFRHRESPR